MNRFILSTALLAATASALSLGGCVTITNTLPVDRTAHVASAPSPYLQPTSYGATCSCACGAQRHADYGAHYGGYDPRYYPPVTEGPRATDARDPQYHPQPDARMYPPYGGYPAYGRPRVVYVPVPQRGETHANDRADQTTRRKSNSGSTAFGGKGGSAREGTRATGPSSTSGGNVCGGRSPSTRRDSVGSKGVKATTRQPLPERTDARATRSVLEDALHATVDVVDVVGRATGNPAVVAPTSETSVRAAQTGEATVGSSGTRTSSGSQTHIATTERAELQPVKAARSDASDAKNVRGAKTTSTKAADKNDSVVPVKKNTETVSGGGQEQRETGGELNDEEPSRTSDDDADVVSVRADGSDAEDSNDE